MWVMCLNDMRSSQIEILTPVCRAPTKEDLLAYLQRERVEPYRDGEWGKCFRQGGPLEWFNEPWNHDDRRHFQNARTRQDWMEEAGLSYDERVMSLPTIA